jgi:hypothetical protein
MKSFLVGGSSTALINDPFIPVQAIRFKRVEDVIGSTFDVAGDIEVFNA